MLGTSYCLMFLSPYLEFLSILGAIDTQLINSPHMITKASLGPMLPELRLTSKSLRRFQFPSKNSSADPLYFPSDFCRDQTSSSPSEISATRLTL